MPDIWSLVLNFVVIICASSLYACVYDFHCHCVSVGIFDSLLLLLENDSIKHLSPYNFIIKV